MELGRNCPDFISAAKDNDSTLRLDNIRCLNQSSMYSCLFKEFVSINLAVGQLSGKKNNHHACC